MKNKLSISNFIEIFKKHLLILILFTGIIFIPSIFFVNDKAKLHWNITFNLHQNEDLLYPYISSVLDKIEDEKNLLYNKSIEKSDLFNKTYFSELKEISKFSSYVVAQSLRNNDIEFSVAKNKLSDEFGSFVEINAVLPSDIGAEIEIKNYMKKLEKETSSLLSYLLKMQYGLDLINTSNDNLLNFRIRSIAFIDNKNLLIIKSFIICLSISYSLIFLFVNRKKISFI